MHCAIEPESDEALIPENGAEGYGETFGAICALVVLRTLILSRIIGMFACFAQDYNFSRGGTLLQLAH